MSNNAIMRFFSFDHLPDGPAKSTSAECFAMACSMDAQLTDSAEKSAGLRKLLEAKDCFVRAALPTEVKQDTR
jgi:hypothetical protein